jgi:hypothetical protein
MIRASTAYVHLGKLEIWRKVNCNQTAPSLQLKEYSLNLVLVDLHVTYGINLIVIHIGYY